MTRRTALGLMLATLLWSPLAHADVASRIGLKVKGVVQGNKQPELRFTPTEAVKQIKITLFRSDEKKLQLSAHNLSAGQQKSIAVQQPNGTFGYKAKFEVTWSDGQKSELRIKFDLTRASDFSMTIDPKEVDLDNRTLRFSLSTAGDRVELRVFDASDKQLTLKKKSLAGAAAGTKHEISWSTGKADLAYMKLRAWNPKGFWTETTLKPVSLRIPHQDVVFDSGRSSVKPSEAHKLKDTLARLRQAVELHGKTINVRLYVAGYTDTVGNPAGNRLLSTARARSIGAWFRGKGLSIPIYYQGFGEDVLAVTTPDETDEPQNRRALYLLSTHTPAESTDFPKASWKKL